MSRPTTLLCALLFTALPLVASAQLDLAYQVGIGATIPVGDLSGRLSPGIHVDGGVYYKFYPGFAAGLHIDYDNAFGKKGEGSVINFEHSGRFTGISGRIMYSGGDFFRYFVQLGVGLWFFDLTECTNGPSNCKGPVSHNKFGMSVQVGGGFKVWEELTIGPAVSITYPDFTQFLDIILLNVHAGLQWNF